MTKRKAPAQLIGGPLDGQEYSTTTKWPHYLGDDGKPISVKAGDRVFGKVRELRPDVKIRSCYITRVDPQTQVRTYVHSSVES